MHCYLAIRFSKITFFQQSTHYSLNGKAINNSDTRSLKPNSTSIIMHKKGTLFYLTIISWITGFKDYWLYTIIIWGHNLTCNIIRCLSWYCWCYNKGHWWLYGKCFQCGRKETWDMSKYDQMMKIWELY